MSIFKKLQEKKAAKTGGHCIQVAKEVPNDFAPLNTDRLVEAQAVASTLRTRLVGKLQTHTLDGMRSAEFGRLNPRRLWRSAVNDGRVFQKRQPRIMEATAVSPQTSSSASIFLLSGL